METAALDTVQVDGLTIGYRELGEGPPVLLLHGWPTSSYLWRDVMPAIARSNRVIAPDLPGFGVSDKPLGVRYDFAFFERAIDGLLEALEVDTVGLAVHDLGGPIGLHWTRPQPGARDAPGAAQHARLPPVRAVRDRVRHDLDHARAARARNQPRGARRAGPAGHARGLRGHRRAGRGLRRPVRLGRLAPRAGGCRRRPRLRGLHRDRAEAAGADHPRAASSTARTDRALTDVADTMARVARDLPQALVTALPGRGHFIQEEAPEEVGELLAEEFRSGGASPPTV